ncbi:hypothetical protein H6P81_007044 [Aristolochia fimbriata]|uniref:Pectinesterase inhibitor domain-containing protein n=1 Tax=Aristolochia fimbriata TaxID=158543 RepID=A0AAV7EZ15_ARIFI|nr:hypothetical protein H6P81_007044 [Aristolochia fimbriata]
MATLDQQPLLGRPRRSGPPLCKALFLTLCVVSLVSLAALVAVHLASANHFTVCAVAKNPTSCLALISREVVRSGVVPLTQIELLRTLLKRSVSGVAAAAEVAHRVRNLVDPVVLKQQSGVSDCVQLLDLSRDLLEDSALALRSSSRLGKRSHSDDVHTWISAVLTNYDTCLEGLQGTTANYNVMKTPVEDLMALASTSLAILTSLSPPAHSVEDFLKRDDHQYYPSWVTSNDLKSLIQGGEWLPSTGVTYTEGL